ncbi:MAG: DMT family transporter [Pseudomonadota bacterium]
MLQRRAMQDTRPALSMICTLSGMFVLALTDNLVVLISETSSLWFFQTIRGALAVSMIGCLALLGLVSLKAKRPLRVIARNAMTATSLLVYFGCLAFLPIGVVAAGFLTAPIWVLVFSILFRGTRAGPRRLAAVALGFAGALMVVWPEEGSLTLLSFTPILAGVFYAISAIGTRAWCEGEGTWVMTFAYVGILGLYGLTGLIILTIWPIGDPAAGVQWVTTGYVAPTVTFGWVTLAQAVGSILGVLLLTRGYQLGEASYVAINEYSMIVFASFFAWLLWDQTISEFAMIGMGLIILSGSIIALRSDRPRVPA